MSTKIPQISIVVIAILSSFFSVAGVRDQLHYLVVIYGAVLLLLAILDKASRLRPHLIWMLILAAVWIQTYRQYQYQKQRADHLQISIQTKIEESQRLKK